MRLAVTTIITLHFHVILVANSGGGGTAPAAAFFSASAAFNRRTVRTGGYPAAAAGEAFRHQAIQALNGTLDLLLVLNASCEDAVAAACERRVSVAGIFGSQAQCQAYMATRTAQNPASLRLGGGGADGGDGVSKEDSSTTTASGWCRVNITSCADSLAAWQTACFLDLVQCNISVQITYANCPMADMFQHQKLRAHHGALASSQSSSSAAAAFSAFAAALESDTKGSSSSGGGGGGGAIHNSDGFSIGGDTGLRHFGGSRAREELSRFVREHPVLRNSSSGHAHHPRSGVEVVDEALRATLGCALLFQELCTRPVALRERAGMTAANCSAALQLRAPQARVVPCEDALRPQQRQRLYGHSIGGSGDSKGSSRSSTEEEEGVLWCNDTVEQWRADCHESLHRCREAAAAAHPERCDEEALAEDSAMLAEMKRVKKVEAILAALLGPDAAAGAARAMATNPANANVLTEEAAHLQAKKREVAHTRSRVRAHANTHARTRTHTHAHTHTHNPHTKHTRKRPQQRPPQALMLCWFDPRAGTLTRHLWPRVF